jgi:hypothetical protein
MRKSDVHGRTDVGSKILIPMAGVRVAATVQRSDQLLFQAPSFTQAHHIVDYKLK